MKVLVVGRGFGERCMATIYRRLGLDVALVSSRDPDGIAKLLGEAPDLVSVHSPPFLHHAHVMAALDQGHAVLCDKPFGRNSEEAEAMYQRARQVGAANFLNFEFRHQPARVRAKALLEAGAIGTLRHIHWTMIGNGLRDLPYGWLFDADRGGGWIGAFGSHAIDNIRWLCGSEIEACGGQMRIDLPFRTDPAGERRPVTAEDGFSAWFRTGERCTVSLDTGFSTPVQLPQRIVLIGSDGAIELVNDLSLTVRRPGEDHQSETFQPAVGDPHEPALLPWLTSVCEALREGRTIGPDFADGLAVARVMEALRAGPRAVGHAPSSSTLIHR